LRERERRREKKRKKKELILKEKEEGTELVDENNKTEARRNRTC
jgi:hypothetical protein